MEFKEIMAEFTTKVGITNAEPDEDGVYTLSFDGMDVAFLEMPEAGRLLLSATIADKPVEGSERLAEILLQMNYLFSVEEGNVVALDGEHNRYILQRRDALALLDAASVYSLVESFVNRLEEYRKMVVDFVPILDEAQKREDSEREAISGFGSQGFIQV